MTTWIVIFWISAALLLYSQFGYPLIVGCLAAFRRRRTVTDSASLPSVTVIIPVHDEEKILAAKLENTLSLDYPAEKLEVLVASDGSSDRSIEISHSFQHRGVKTLEFTSRRGKSSVVNDAVREASGDVLCLCDANVLFEPQALWHLVRHLQDPEIGAVTGDVQLASEQSEFGEGERAYYWIERWVQEKESLLNSTIGVDGGMYAVRRELYEPIPNTILDDFVIAMQVIRRGKRVVYEPAAIAHETATIKPLHEFRRRVRVAAGAVQVLKRGQFPGWRQPVAFWQFCSHKLLRWIGPLLLAALLVSSIILWNHGTIFRVALGMQVGAYLLALLGLLMPAVRRTRVGGVAFYFVLSHLAMTLGLAKGIANRQSAAWARTERAGLAERPASNPNVVA